MEPEELKEALVKTTQNFRKMLPMLVGVVLLVGLAITAIPGSTFTRIFTGNSMVDSVIGSAAGSIAAGNPINSYVIGGELLQNGVSLVAVAAFIIAWITVGVVTLPAEGLMLGKRFALIRNLSGFVLAVIISIILAWLLGVL